MSRRATHHGILQNDAMLADFDAPTFGNKFCAKQHSRMGADDHIAANSCIRGHPRSGMRDWGFSLMGDNHAEPFSAFSMSVERFPTGLRLWSQTTRYRAP